MSRAQDRTARLMERFEQTPEQDAGEPASPSEPAVPARATATKTKGQRRLAAADPAPSNIAKVANSADVVLEPHTKRTFYVRTAHVERLETEHRRLNYELNGVKLVEILDAVLDEGFKHFADVEALLRDRN